MVVHVIEGKNCHAIIKAAETSDVALKNYAIEIPKCESIALDFGYGINENQILGKDGKLLSLGAVECSGSFNKKMLETGLAANNDRSWAGLVNDWGWGMKTFADNDTILDINTEVHDNLGYIIDFIVNYTKPVGDTNFANTLLKVNQKQASHDTNAEAYGADAIVYRMVFAFTKESVDLNPNAEVIESITLQVRNITIPADATTIKECIETLYTE